MKSLLSKFLSALVTTGLIGIFGAYAAEPSVVHGPTAEQFAKLQALIMPRPGEGRWEKIPWLTSLWQARQKAAAQGKPILLWEMDGHPLGCT